MLNSLPVAILAGSQLERSIKSGRDGAPASAAGLFCDDVHEFSGDDDDLGDREAGGGLADFRGGEGGGFDFLFRGGFRNSNAVAEFSVHLHREFDFGFGEEGFVVLGPGLLRSEAGEAEAVPEFLRKMGREGAEERKEDAEGLARAGGGVNEFVRENHHL